MDSMEQPNVATRKALSRSLRFEILRRDNHTCRYCGGKAPDVSLTVDHVIPVALGGTDDPSNLCAACRDCNFGKGSTSPDAETVSDVADGALGWAQAMEQAALLAAQRAQQIHEYVAAFEEAWSDWGAGPNRTEIWRPGNWEQSVRHWQTLGMPITVLIDCIRIAMTNQRVQADQTWRYFCGVAWGHMRQIQDEAEVLR